MTSARPVLPTDLLALVSYNGKVYPNEARPRERIGAADITPNPLETALEQWLPLTNRRTVWINARRQRLLGLVSARHRGGRQAWEIDCLIDTTPVRDEVLGPVERAVQAAGEAGAEKIFLRLDAGSPLLAVVAKVGFAAYSAEQLYVGEKPRSVAETLSLRPFSQQDQYPAFRLYNCLVPERHRRAEAATFGEWQAAQERHWLKGGVRFVIEKEGALIADIKASRLPQGTLIDIIADQAALAQTGGLIAAAAQAVGYDQGPLMLLVPDSAADLARRLSDLGFSPRQEFACLMCRTARVAHLPKMAPAAIPKGAVIT
jgi:hypothetical protein